MVQDSSGNALSGVSVEVRKQGATINGDQGAVTTYTVNSPGAIAAADTVAIGTSATTASVSSVTATTVVVGATLGAVSDDDRITHVLTLPTLYNDAEGAETKANPLTTGSTGQVTCWLTGGYYDIKVSGGAATTTLYQDQWVGAETVTSNEYDAAAAVAFIRNTGRSLSTAGALLEDWRNNADSKFKIGYDGAITATGSGRFVGNVSASGVYAPLGQFSSVVATGSSITTMTATGLSGLPSAISTSMIATGALSTFQTVAGTTADSPLNGSYSLLEEMTLTITPARINSKLLFWLDVPRVSSAGGATINYRVFDSTVSATAGESEQFIAAGAAMHFNMHAAITVTATGARTYEAQWKGNSADPVQDSTSGTGTRVRRFTMLELKA